MTAAAKRDSADAVVRADSFPDALRPEALRTLSAAALLAYLRGRRWFGAKGREPRSARVRDVVPLPWEQGPFAVARVEVDLGDVSHLYQLPLAVRAEGGELPEGAADAVLARVEAGSVRGVLFDATLDSTFRARLGQMIALGARFEGEGGARLVFEHVGSIGNAEGRMVFPTIPNRVGSAEQSNTSIVYDERLMLKLFRRLEAGENPDVEIGRFLTTKALFPNTPMLVGVVRFDEADGTRTVAGMLSRFYADSRDAWAHALLRARAYLKAGTKGTKGTKVKKGAKGDEQPPPNPFADEARALGRVTRLLHESLASEPDDPDFAPEPADAEDVEEWAAATHRSIDGAFDLLGARGDALDASARAPAQALLRRREGAHARVDEIADAVEEDAGARIRHHGDYHLGQVLRTPDNQWMIIDFEGEPARPLAERRAKHSPLRDVAGMMRSFAYAAATAAMDVGGVGTDAAVETRAARWERDVRAAFLDGYLRSDAASARAAAGRDATLALLPQSAEDTTALLTLFEIEKIFYELSYELNNRPAWAWIPLRGIAKLF